MFNRSEYLPLRTVFSHDVTQPNSIEEAFFPIHTVTGSNMQPQTLSLNMFALCLLVSHSSMFEAGGLRTYLNVSRFDENGNGTLDYFEPLGVAPAQHVQC